MTPALNAGDTSISDPRTLDPPKVSIIVPIHRWNERSARCIERCLELRDSCSCEVIGVSDNAIDDFPGSARLVVTGARGDSSPALKRDTAGAIAQGEFLAYIDDDAYPEPDWIDRALEAINDLDADGVGGPGLTPQDSSWRERLSGAVYGSILGSGPLRHRFVVQGERRLVDEIPAYNFVAKRKCIEVIGGWRSHFYGGEDTSVCTRLRSHGFRLAYVPDAIVYHYRREALAAHLRQVGNVGRHRGYFVRRRDESSLRKFYLVPTLFTLAFPVAVIGAIIGLFQAPIVTAPVITAMWLMLALIAFRDAGIKSLLFPGILVMHHLWYGTNFAIGLVLRSLDEERDAGIPESRR